MGSLAEDVEILSYPHASDPALVLTQPTEAEKEQTWRLNHREWGGALNLSAYLKREPFLASTPLASDGGMVHWILTESSARSSLSPVQKRNVLASSETIQKRVLYVPPNGDKVREGLGYGIGSVYTYPEFRGRKYAARMLGELGSALRTWHKAEQQPKGKQSSAVNGTRGTLGSEKKNLDGDAQDVAMEAVCSALWSDIGKKYYASKGWPVFASDHVEFPCPSSLTHGFASLLEQSKHASLTVTPVNERNIAQLCREDEALLRTELLTHARENNRTAFAFAPTPDVMRWHWSREDFVASHVFPGRRPSDVKGMIATVSPTAATTTTNGTASEKEARVWAIWSRSFSADTASDPSKNTLYILRFVIDDAEKSADRQSLQIAFDTIIQCALDAARSWHCGSVHLWNPNAAVRDLIAGSGVAHSFVHRDVDSIPSMMWYGSEGDGTVDWIANEKFCWC